MQHISKVDYQHYQKLRLVLGDQLNAGHSWFKEHDQATLYVIAELKQETDYAKHHVQKVSAFFLAMAHFAKALSQAGHQILYLSLDQTQSFADLPDLLTNLCQQYQIREFSYQLPDEYRLRVQLEAFAQTLDIDTKSVETEHFYLDEKSLAKQFKKAKHHRMEAFYRRMRTTFALLMDGDEPLGGQWNFDAQNRQKLKPTDIDNIPSPLLFANDVSDILLRLARHHVKTIGESTEQLLWPVNRQQAVELLKYFCQHCLPNFGRFQDAMTCQQDLLATQNTWSLYHSRLSFALNSKMISPKLVVDTALEYYYSQPDVISLAQIEGFVRQIVGWREFIRGIYWANMPDYAALNTLEAKRELPQWFWTGDTKMHCQHQAIKQSLDYAYAHHIQRLMVTGNFCLLAGIEPDEVDAWYLGIYIDAIEWVEMPNTRGMSQFADGGIVGSKAYAASGNYINKMSDYCGSCHYQVKELTSANACPLNSLYWRFMASHEDKFKSNPRNRMVYANWYKKSDEQREQVLTKAEEYLAKIEQL
ncbi:cryptochrome/photolyase family protein [Thalassotalea sp. LPB0316]|uniref:cryptochrome/photolyase family protein n=1 Tax=Thalassotalea sp. LPB0316 TaxID=2769490 RepID=UPI0018680048|nr:cryptochrome/photolyase family protein [Thalassotalea sp. LPB0316]QOL25606.1 cryptochrome/photolyase family protein [Thalassotalea sp. LPB0316]